MISLKITSNHGSHRVAHGFPIMLIKGYSHSIWSWGLGGTQLFHYNHNFQIIQNFAKISIICLCNQRSKKSSRSRNWQRRGRSIQRFELIYQQVANFASIWMPKTRRILQKSNIMVERWKKRVFKSVLFNYWICDFDFHKSSSFFIVAWSINWVSVRAAFENSVVDRFSKSNSCYCNIQRGIPH